VFRQFVFNADETLFVENSAAGPANFTDGPNFTFFPSKILDASVPGNTSVVDGLKWHNQRALAGAPQERYSFFASGSYDFSDNVTLFSRAMLAESETRTVLFGTNAIFGWEGLVPYNPATDSPLNPVLNYADPAVVAAVIADPTNPAFANPGFIPTGAPGAQHPVPVELAVLLNSRGNPAGDWMPGWSPDSSLPPRSTRNTNTVWQVEAGLDLQLPGDWTGEIYLSHGQSSTCNNASGNLSLARHRALIRQPDYGRNTALSGNATGQSPGFGAADITCTSGFYDPFFHGDEPLSRDCFDAINATLQTRAQNIQDIFEATSRAPSPSSAPASCASRPATSAARTRRASCRTSCSLRSRSRIRSSASIRRATWMPRCPSTISTSSCSCRSSPASAPRSGSSSGSAHARPTTSTRTRRKRTRR
jgi:hypothetical protein